MYPDLITPRAHPELLSKVDYDPYQLMPAALPPAPRVFVTQARLNRARQRLAAGSVVDQHCYAELLKTCKLDEPLPALKAASGQPDWRGVLLPCLHLAFRHALAHTLNDDPRHRERALAALRLAAEATAHLTQWSGHEHQEAQQAAGAYDLLAPHGFSPDDDNRFRAMLNTLVAALDHGGHRYCNNHNSMNQSGRLALAAALGNRQYLHDALYGCGRGGSWRYGLLHTLRHDFLADGMNWEGVPGYHMLVMMMVCESLTIMENLGVDLWRRRWPALNQDDGFDEHRGWGPKGEKSLTSAFDALIYQAFGNGDYSHLHDQVLGNLRGTWVWWRLFNKAWEVYGEPRYAWVLAQINGGVPARAAGPVPVWFSGGHGATEFVRHEARELPAGENPLPGSHAFAQLGRHEHGSSLFPVHGSALLRTNPSDPRAVGVYAYWGPHWAGHRSPAPLHVEWHAHGERVSTAPHLFQRGYDEPKHLTWLRSTVAHNTVTVDERPALPYDFETQSLWECDHWRDTLSDSVLLGCHLGPGYQAWRASNDNVYTGVLLDRAVLVANGVVADVFRVTAATARQYDWAMHLNGQVPPVPGAPMVDLGQARGYRHFSDAWRYPASAPWVKLSLTGLAGPVHAALWLGGAPGTQLIVAHDPPVDQRTPIGDRVAPRARQTLLLRTQAQATVFVSLWSFGAPLHEPACAVATDGTVRLSATQGSQPWQASFPATGLPQPR